jgi:hypothetical protein
VNFLPYKLDFSLFRPERNTQLGESASILECLTGKGAIQAGIDYEHAANFTVSTTQAKGQEEIRRKEGRVFGFEDIRSRPPLTPPREGWYMAGD